ncbi:MAG TPA: bifunctional folylpolyglutamate synthase/dihydrofolate synthase, partial [Caldimonas sp.]|nr:bifunctional folylpolyglutamate synthase/dihydrofolate synthase [Caldimonas sp.]
ADLAAACRCLAGDGRSVTIAEHASPVAALDAALADADPVDRIVVFGSFYTVAGILAHGLPRRSGRHIA